MKITTVFGRGKGLAGLARRALQYAKQVVMSSPAEAILSDIARQPMDYYGHFELAKHYMNINEAIPAVAELRTSLALGGEDPEIYSQLAKAYLNCGCRRLAEDVITHNDLPIDNLPKPVQPSGGDGLLKLSPLRYQRLKALADAVEQSASEPRIRVLDVGGGDGALSLFMPDVMYVLY